jgi:hypothetical protein
LSNSFFIQIASILPFQESMTGPESMPFPEIMIRPESMPFPEIMIRPESMTFPEINDLSGINDLFGN